MLRIDHELRAHGNTDLAVLQHHRSRDHPEKTGDVPVLYRNQGRKRAVPPRIFQQDVFEARGEFLRRARRAGPEHATMKGDNAGDVFRAKLPYGARFVRYCGLQHARSRATKAAMVATDRKSSKSMFSSDI